MNVGRRAVLVAGGSSVLAYVHAGPYRRRVLAVHADGPGAADPGELAAWLRERLPAGAEVDVVYRDHFLTVETFPALDAAELVGAMRVRLKRDLLTPPETFTSLTVPIVGPGVSQGVFAGVASAAHLALVRAIGAARLRVGRVAFAGQLALCALSGAAPQGGWAIVTHAGPARQLLIGVSASGQAFAATYPEGADLRATGREVVKLNLPHLDVRDPVDLDAGAAGSAVPGPALPAGLRWLLPALLDGPRWRIASQADIDYPYHFGQATWLFLASMAALFVYTGWLVLDIRDRQETAPEVERVTRSIASVTAKRKQLEGRLAALDALESNTRFLKGELFATDRWLHMVGDVRDRHAPGLLFDAITDSDEFIVLAGSTPEMGAILRLYRALVERMGDDALVKLYTISRDAKGRATYRLQIQRVTYQPPAGKG